MSDLLWDDEKIYANNLETADAFSGFKCLKLRQVFIGVEGNFFLNTLS